MAIVRPSDVMRKIQDCFPRVASGSSPRSATLQDGPPIAAVVDLVDRIPQSTLNFPDDAEVDFFDAMARLRHLGKRIESEQATAVGGWPMMGTPSENVFVRPWHILASCQAKSADRTGGIASPSSDTGRGNAAWRYVPAAQ